MTVQKPRERNLELIDTLKGHERTDPYHTARLREEILKDGCQRDPITVDAKTNVILDGHHRAEIFKALNLSLIAVHRVDYDSPEIVVRTWLPTVSVEPQAVMNELRLNNEAASADSKETITLVWNEGEQRLPGTREQVMNSVVGKFPITYVRDERTGDELSRRKVSHHVRQKREGGQSVDTDRQGEGVSGTPGCDQGRCDPECAFGQQTASQDDSTRVRKEAPPCIRPSA